MSLLIVVRSNALLCSEINGQPNPSKILPLLAMRMAFSMISVLLWVRGGVQFLNVPDQVVRGLSSECMDFMMSFICDSDSRLGKRNVDEIKNHPWFASLVSFVLY